MAFSIDDTIGDLMGDPGAKGVLEKHLPEMVKSPQIMMAASLSLKAVAKTQPGKMTPELMQAIADDLAKL